MKQAREQILEMHGMIRRNRFEVSLMKLQKKLMLFRLRC